MKYNEINVGDSAAVVHTITDKDIEQFVQLTGDDNKLHVDKEYASKTDFKIPVVHGMLGASFISTLIGTKIPGDGALWFSQTLDFLRPVRVGDTITVEAEVISKNDKQQSIELKTDIVNQHKQIVTTGIAKVKVIEQVKPEPQTDVKPLVREKTALILGATGGIGNAIAHTLAANGFNLILHYHLNHKKANDLNNALLSMGVRTLLVKANLLNESEVDQLMDQAMRHFPKITAFVNASTVKIPSIRFHYLEWKEIQGHLDINVKVAFSILKKLLPAMEAEKYGKIIFLSTQAVDSPNGDWLHYITAKSALEGFAKSLAMEYASKQINVNIVSPGMTDTELIADIPQKSKMLIEAKTPLKRLCKPEDVAEAVAYLLSDKASFMTGETLRINGGQQML